MHARKVNIFILLFLFSIIAFGQNNIIITGSVKDVATEEPLEYVRLFLKRHKVGAITDSLGNFRIPIPSNTITNDTLTVSFMGYSTSFIPVNTTRKNDYTIKLTPSVITMKNIVITSKKESYKKKNNPAVELIEKVIARKDKNIIESNDFYEYEKHEIIQLCINDFSNKKSFLNRIMHWFDFSTKYADYSELNNRNTLPFYINENISNFYYRKKTKSLKTELKGNKTIEIHRMIDMKGFEATIKEVFSDINIYDNAINIFGNEFMSPLSPLSSSFYKFYISDTTLIGKDSCINLVFLPRNTADFGFLGNIFILKDTNSLAVRKVELRLPPKSGVNWVDELLIIQEFSYINNNWCLTKDEAMADMSIISNGLGSCHIRRSNTYKNYIFNNPKSDSTYTNTTIIKNNNPSNSKLFSSLRLRQLYPIEKKTYEMYDELKHSYKFKFLSNAALAVSTGYIPIGIVDAGPWDAILSYNDIEGYRMRLGGRTNTLLHNNLFANGYIAYGSIDERAKYQVGLNYSFNKRRFFLKEYPKNLLSITYQADNKIPGNPVSFGNTYDRIALSFRSNPLTKMTADKIIGLQYEKDLSHGLSYDISFMNIQQLALGEMNFNTNTISNNSFRNSQFSLKIRFAPGEKFYQTNEDRRSLNNSYPVVSFKYNLGIKDLLNADYTFHKLELGLSKRTYFSGFGYADLNIECGKIWNPVPYPLLFIPQGNQSYYEIKTAYNMMNIMEFISDQYLGFSFNYMSTGLLFNRIPLVKYLKLRESLLVKAVWGSLNLDNLPENNSNLMAFPLSSTREHVLSRFGNTPYIEAAFGIYNIFNILKIDIFKRFTYLENPNTIPWGIRFTFKFGF